MNSPASLYSWALVEQLEFLVLIFPSRGRINSLSLTKTIKQSTEKLQQSSERRRFPAPLRPSGRQPAKA